MPAGVLSFLADIVLVAHLAFVVFVVLGGLLVFRWPRVAWLHIPCALWGGLVEMFGWLCPLTPLEVALRRAAGEGGYRGGFLEYYLEPLLYPPGLSRGWQVGLGLFVITLNAVIYLTVWRRRRAGRSERV